LNGICYAKQLREPTSGKIASKQTYPLIWSKKLTKDSGDGKPVPKKQKGGKQQSEKHKALGEMIIYPKWNMDWNCKGKYHKIFRGKVISETPPFNNTGLITCNKWHIQGWRFKECTKTLTSHLQMRIARRIRITMPG
jgi:hypothetical protein